MAYPECDTIPELMMQAAAALVRRDHTTLERLENHTHGWMTNDTEQVAMQLMMQAMIEAAYLLEDEPSEIEIEDEDEG